jgi:trk system potassium uptake protein TrkH
VDGVSLGAAAYEAASAIGTVGLSMGITPSLSVPSRLIVICLMFLGRVGILSFSMAFLTRSRLAPKVKRPAFNIMIG